VQSLKGLKDVTEIYAKLDPTLEVKERKKCSDCGYEYPVIGVSKHINPFGTEEGKIKFDKCPKCLVDEEDNHFREQAKHDMQWRIVDKYGGISSEPNELKDATLDDYEPKNETQEKAKKSVIDFLNGDIEQTTLFFQGDTGLGKTHLSYCVYKSYMDSCHPAIFIDTPNLMNKIRSTYNKDAKTTQEDIMKKIKDVELLVIDDVGAEYVKPDANGYESWAADILYQVVNDRQGKKNIFTTNFTSKHLAKKYGMMSKRILSRMMSNAKIIKVEGDDHRLKGLD
jgi:DNA replication protein DnaC